MLPCHVSIKLFYSLQVLLTFQTNNIVYYCLNIRVCSCHNTTYQQNMQSFILQYFRTLPIYFCPPAYIVHPNGMQNILGLHNNTTKGRKFLKLCVYKQRIINCKGTETFAKKSKLAKKATGFLLHVCNGKFAAFLSAFLQDNL